MIQNRMLDGKNAIITGARSGIGLSTLQLFAKNGCNCWAVVHRDDDEFTKQIQQLEADCHVWIKIVHIDLSNSDSIKEGVKSILKEKHSIDILVNAAGVVSPNRLFTMTKMEDMRRVMDVNFFSAIELTQLVCRPMTRQRYGSIINVASVAGIDGDPAQLEYSASKAALICATKKLAFELGGLGIRVNAVAPGTTDTKMLDAMSDDVKQEMVSKVALGRMARPEEIADVVLFLASEKSSYIAGQTIRVDGCLSVAGKK